MGKKKYQYNERGKRAQGIYAIVNKRSGMLYVGRTSGRFWERWSTHERELTNGTHHCYLLQQHWNQWGRDAFDFVILEELPLKSDFGLAEARHMQKHRALLYNTQL